MSFLENFIGFSFRDCKFYHLLIIFPYDVLLWTKVLNFFYSQIHLFFFFAIAFVFWNFYYLPSSHPSPTLRLQGYSVFYSVYFIVLLLTFGSSVHLESEVIYEVRQESSFDISSHNNLSSSFPMLFIKQLSFSVNLSISLSHLSIYYLSLSDTNFSCVAWFVSFWTNTTLLLLLLF